MKYIIKSILMLFFIIAIHLNGNAFATSYLTIKLSGEWKAIKINHNPTQEDIHFYYNVFDRFVMENKSHNNFIFGQAQPINFDLNKGKIIFNYANTKTNDTKLTYNFISRNLVEIISKTKVILFKRII